ncbi:hypothetical protein VPNG_04563 [Cytospora leucostoma]|uniref:Uncharacterized protein n=1 Tax=Cytospora leucostoma TaxID=1230097 RepID=A0A423XC64_9PEZI|nr:hypothetical protein VPNG_04563 [Cytospora leucostoma]
MSQDERWRKPPGKCLAYTDRPSGIRTYQVEPCQTCWDEAQEREARAAEERADRESEERLAFWAAFRHREAYIPASHRYVEPRKRKPDTNRHPRHTWPTTPQPARRSLPASMCVFHFHRYICPRCKRVYPGKPYYFEALRRCPAAEMQAHNPSWTPEQCPRKRLLPSYYAPVFGRLCEACVDDMGKWVDQINAGYRGSRVQ